MKPLIAFDFVPQSNAIKDNVPCYMSKAIVSWPPLATMMSVMASPSQVLGDAKTSG
eukprot:gene21877-biopygen7639